MFYSFTVLQFYFTVVEIACDKYFQVEILTGKDKGKHGIVCEIIQERNWVFVEGLNTYLQLKGKTKKFPGMLVKTEAPLLVTTEVSLVDPSDL